MRAVNFSLKFIIGVFTLMVLYCLYMYFDFLQLRSPSDDSIFGLLVNGENVEIGSQKVFSVLMSIMCGISISWSLFFMALSYRLLKEKQAWMVDLMLVSIIIWYISDSYASFHFGLNANVLSNTVFFILVIVPLLIIRKPIKQEGLATQ